jgi:hypothetical protein
MITRDQYMANSSALHQAYYLEIARDSGVSYARSPELPCIRAALANGDTSLNTIPLAWWDARAMQTPARSEAFRSRGDYPTLAGLVCMHKAAAKEAAKS